MRSRAQLAKELMRKPKGKFSEVSLKDGRFVPKGMTRAYANNRYVVMVYDNVATTKGFAIRAMIQKHDNAPIIGHWSEIQAIKNEIFGKETTAIEYYPPKSKLIDDYNIYWIWIFNDGDLPVPIL